MKYETLLCEAHEIGLIVKEKPLEGNDGRIKGNRIAIRQSIDTNKRKACVLAEELGHYYTTVGNIINQDDISNQKQERFARGWAYNRLIPLEDIMQAYNAGYTEIYDMAEYLDTDEAFLRECLTYYEEKYGDQLVKERQARQFKEAMKHARIKFYD